MIDRRMAARPLPPNDYPAFDGLPVQLVCTGPAAARVAVHLRGDFASGQTPLVCLAGYHRNMSDYARFLPVFLRETATDWPIVLIDLLGRGRATDRPRNAPYSVPADTRDLVACLDALGIERAYFLGQGHGGHVVMALGAVRPTLIAGAVLIDAGPLVDAHGLVRLRSAMAHVHALKTDAEVSGALVQSLAAVYPGLGEDELLRLAARTHMRDKRGRAVPLFDPRLIDQLDAIGTDDTLEVRWDLFDSLANVPLLMMRTQMTDQLRRETFEQMARRRRDAVALALTGQGSPALLDHADEVGAIADFLLHANALKAATA